MSPEKKPCVVRNRALRGPQKESTPGGRVSCAAVVVGIVVGAAVGIVVACALVLVAVPAWPAAPFLQRALRFWRRVSLQCKYVHIT